VGPVRTSGLAFGTLAIYPVLLLVICRAAGGGAPWGATALTAANVVFGLGLTGVLLGWTLGPVALAGSPEKVPHYAAIHATLVGVRGLVLSGPGDAVQAVGGLSKCRGAGGEASGARSDVAAHAAMHKPRCPPQNRAQLMRKERRNPLVRAPPPDVTPCVLRR
jgi:hypothetical protein